MVLCIKFLSFFISRSSLSPCLSPCLSPSFLPVSLSFLFFFLSLPLSSFTQRNTSGHISMLLLSQDLRTRSEWGPHQVSSAATRCPAVQGERRRSKQIQATSRRTCEGSSWGVGCLRDDKAGIPPLSVPGQVTGAFPRMSS